MCRLLEVLKARKNGAPVANSEIYAVIASDGYVPRKEKAEVLKLAEELNPGNCIGSNPYVFILELHGKEF